MEKRHINIQQFQEVLQKIADDRDWNQYHSPRNLAMAKTNLNALVKGLVQPHIGGRTMIIEYK